MSCRQDRPVARPVASAANPEISSRSAASCPVVPATLLTCPSVGSYPGRCAFGDDFYLSGDLFGSALYRRGGCVACPLGWGGCVPLACRLFPSYLTVPPKERENRGELRSGRDGGAS